RGAALGRHGRERLPAVGGGVVFPRVVERAPCGRAGVRQVEAAERIDFVVERSEGDVVGRKLHRLLLRPFVGRRVVFIDERLGRHARPGAEKPVGLAAPAAADPSSGGAGEGGGRPPGGGRRRRGGRLRERVGEGNARRNSKRPEDDASRHAFPPIGFF